MFVIAMLISVLAVSVHAGDMHAGRADEPPTPPPSARLSEPVSNVDEILQAIVMLALSLS
jgi:hypothetical protein